MGVISKIIKTGVKKLKLDSLENAKIHRTAAAKRLAELKKEGMPEAVILKAKNDLRKAEAAMRKFSGKSSASPVVKGLGGKDRTMATKGKSNRRRAKVQPSSARDFVKKGAKLQAGKQSDKEAGKAGEKVVKEGMEKFDKTLSADDLFKGERVPRKKYKGIKEAQEGQAERARSTKRRQRYEATKKDKK